MFHKHAALALIATAVATVLSACGAEPARSAATEDAAAEAQVVKTDLYSKVLKAHVGPKGFVNYAGLKANRQPLDDYIASLGQLDPKRFQAWDQKKQIALLINAYNAMTLKAIIDHYPIESSFFANLKGYELGIRHISGVWDELTFPLMGRSVTLDQIEHKMLRARYNEPRIHMAINCASIGCPPLLDEPYTGKKLNEQFKSQTRRFLANPSKFRIDRQSAQVYLSPIFKWFGEDFVKSYLPEEGYGSHGKELRAVLNFIAGHLDDSDAAYLRKGDYELEWLDYDWGLNEQPKK
ncbi:MAG: DUF547 domain-containing protein, partial [Phycisphaeraceae bacterium]|nr:DUF547 domain-containing protein [Phycisphaeraceae bacterium]